jgi:hypothetical protein
VAKDPQGQTQPDTCGAAAFAKLIGQPAAALASIARDGPLRVIAYGARATTDFRPTRLTVRLDRDGRIASLTCG